MIGHILKEFRLKNNLTQKQVGEFLGITESMVQKYEFNKADINISKLNKLSKLFKVPIETLITGESKINPINECLAKLSDVITIKKDDFFKESTHPETIPYDKGFIDGLNKAYEVLKECGLNED